MQIASTIAACRAVRSSMQGRVGFVPTMGALHAGHLSLVEASRAACDHTIASIFVNPAQFGPQEDFAQYPRTFSEDCALLAARGVDLLFAPSPAEMYPDGASSRVHVGPVAERLDGASRPGHFAGVATVVAKLFHIATPAIAFFGQKDAAQLAVLRQMVRDLDFPIQLVACPIVREPDGLALSSRNRYLHPEERPSAAVLARALRAGLAAFAGGERQAASILAAAAAVLAEEPAVRLDYLALVDPDTLLPLDPARPGALLAIAAWVGETRLIDNMLL